MPTTPRSAYTTAVSTTNPAAPTVPKRANCIASLASANLTSTNLTGANLRNAYLTDADLTNANLTDADLEGASIPDGFLVSGTRVDAVPWRGTPAGWRAIASPRGARFFPASED